MPRKTEHGDRPVRLVIVLASMRPRPDAAENRDGKGRHREGVRASMRPRPDAAENLPPDGSFGAFFL